MKRILGRELVLPFLTLIFLSGCIQTISPDNTITVQVKDSQLFSVLRANSEDFVWILDGKEVGIGNTYTYTVDREHLGNHQLMVVENWLLHDSRTWTISDIFSETCDGVDNNENGMVDEDIPPVPTACGVGSCRSTGEKSCVDGEWVDSCMPGAPNPLPSCMPYSYPDNLDANCNGVADIKEMPFTTECCNGIDDNNNGLVDDGLPSIPTTCGVGACKSMGELKCVNGQMVDSCSPGEPGKEICGDSLDNNCDGDVDEDCETFVTGKVPDTGQITSYTDIWGEDSDYTINPPSYTKLDINRKDLPDSATEWAMIRDNVTGLIWENKQNLDDLADYSNPHDADNTYTWYDPNPATNGGNAGTPGDGPNTQDFIDALNAANFGGCHAWRLPTIKELSWIVNSNIPFSGPTINEAYFQNTNSNAAFWSSTTSDSNAVEAWYVHFIEGNVDIHNKSYYHFFVRAVRGGE